MEKVLVAKTVANKLYAAEESIDEALVKASALLTGMIDAKTQLNLSTLMGDAAIAELSKAIATLSQSRSAMAEVHKQLDESKLRLGIRTKMSPVLKPAFAEAEHEVTLREVG